MLEEQLITLETAILAKEKKFNLRVRNCFTGTDPKGYDFEHETVNIAVDYNNVEGARIKPLYSRPTQALLQMWLREVHHLHAEVKVEDFVDKPQFYWSIFGKYKDGSLVRCLQNSEDGPNVPGHGKYKTYEEALETCLQAMLNMIEV